MIDDECQCYKNEDEKEHISACIIHHWKINIELGREYKEYNHKREYRSRPKKDEYTKNHKKWMPDGKGDTFRYLDWLIDTLKKGHFCFFYTLGECLGVRVDEVEGYRKAK